MTSKLLKPRNIIYIFILINLLVGLMIVSDYGRSPDEIFEEARASNALNGFSSWEMFQKYQELDKKVLASTPSIFFRLIEDGVSTILNPPPGSVKHYLYFVFFQIGIFSFFIIAKKVMNEWSACGITLLFGTQPLYFGHALMNPKDIPFMAVFLTTIAAGLHMADKLTSNISHSRRSEENGLKTLIAKDWRNLSKRKKKLLFISGLIWPLLYFVYKTTSFFLEKVIHKAYYSTDESILSRWFSKIATQTNSLPIIAYNEKAQHLFNRLFIYFLIVYLIIEIILLLRLFPSLKLWLRLTFVEPHINLFKANKRSYLLPIVLSGIACGLCISSRRYGQAIGLIAGGMVGFYLFLKVREKAVFPLIIYSISAYVSLYIFWPNIWFSGFPGFIKAIFTTTEFAWKGRVLYNGELLPYEMLPRSYLPKLFLLQFTEPVIILGLLGVLLGIYLIKKRKMDATIFFILCCWLFLPIFYSVVFQPTHYNNSRQYLFITPPLFIFAGISFNEIIKLFKKKWIVIIFQILILLPGIYSLFELHPYQYIYYNSFVGGVEGASRNYELDYWFISYKEAMEYLNQVAPQNAEILYWRNGEILEYYAREDLILVNQKNLGNRSQESFDYGIVPSSLNADLKNLLFADVVFQVERDNTVLVVVRKIN